MRSELDLAESEVSVDWRAVVTSLLHPTKLVILEAIAWIGRPLSATELEAITDGEAPLSSFSFHLKQLAKAGILEIVGKVKARESQGTAKETFFYPAKQSQWIDQILGLKDHSDPLFELALKAASSRSDGLSRSPVKY